ncbi:NUDIX domain-containing protein [Candidatus Dojkabacteria bacterium]|nr:NUDIX domain-containing protein [Candidatus Dojkabacteria bacterium]
MQDDKSHYVVTTGIIIKDGKYLITKRSESEAAFPGLWTVPGGKLRSSDYTSRDKDTGDSWYNVLEEQLKREIREETGIEVKNIRYLLSLAYIRSDGIPTLILSFYCDYESGDVTLADELTEFAWIEGYQIGDYEFVPGLSEEIEMVDKKIKGEKVDEWEGKYDSAEDESKRDK